MAAKPGAGAERLQRRKWRAAIRLNARGDNKVDGRGKQYGAALLVIAYASEAFRVTNAGFEDTRRGRPPLPNSRPMVMIRFMLNSFPAAPPCIF